MCWNETVSWITFVLGTLTNISLGLWKRNAQNWIWYVFFQLIICVQLGEALIWKDPHGPLAQIGTFISFMGVWLQPIVAWFILKIYNVRKEILSIIGMLIVLYIYFSIPAFQHMSENTYRHDICQDGWLPHISFTAWAYP